MLYLNITNLVKSNVTEIHSRLLCYLPLFQQNLCPLRGSDSDLGSKWLRHSKPARHDPRLQRVINGDLVPVLICVMLDVESP